jgi:hypothetical protein
MAQIDFSLPLPLGNGNEEMQIKSKEIQDPRPPNRLSKTRYVRIVSQYYCIMRVKVLVRNHTKL